MKRSISPDPFSSAKTVKHVHHSPDDGEEDLSHDLLDDTSGDEREPSPTFHIDPFPVRAKRDSKLYLEEAWALLKPAINIVFRGEYKPGVLSCNEIFHAAKRACFADSGQVQLLYDLIKGECEPHITAAIQSLEKQSGDDPSVFLPLVEKCWLDFRKKMMFVFDLAYYKPCNGTTLWGMGLRLFQKQLSLAPQVQDQVIAGIVGLITDERLHKTSENVSLRNNLMEMFHSKWDVFEKPLLEFASKIYAAKAKEFLQQSDNISDYLKFVEMSLREEGKKYAENYYQFAICRRPLLKAVERELLVVHGSVLEKGFTVLMEEDRMDDVRRMYDLFSRAKLGECMDRMVRSYILEKGAREGSLKELHTSFGKIWHRCFREDAMLNTSIRECFESLGLHVPDEYSDECEWVVVED